MATLRLTRFRAILAFPIATSGCGEVIVTTDAAVMVTSDAEVVVMADADARVLTDAAWRNYRCGFALPGEHCDNGRSHDDITAPDMTAAIATCHALQQMSGLDFCHVLDSQGPAPVDASQCAAASGSWRPNNSCCNFMGTVSCP